ncbi:cytochrome c family protein [Herminiimonas sp. KBW02]|uniref:c-type cytochrome n=1 Tax=Herminiimonas sp. KBW02 TaxID=2153363 RepID=UPI000F59AD2C|nr:cytochrome c family protein [Herminiimonas sp. KBW02]RQO36512.1 cytochrome c family protein [Herminiimonas sp. KBW02]
MHRELLLSLALGVLASASHAAGDVAAGKRVFAKCSNCHQVGPSARGTFGPHLNGIVGRTAGTTKDYKYSTAMRSSRVVWTEANLRAFIKSTDDVVPGNKMRFFGISDEKQLTDLLAYLQTFK